MKKFFFVFVLLVVSSGTPIFLALAASTPPPEVDEPISPVDADKALITGTSEPGARITLTGGAYFIAPVDADEDGRFSITVNLTQESTNRFVVVAQSTGMDQSEAVEVSIEEGEQAAQDYETETGEDRTAPKAPTVEESKVESSDLKYTIEGEGEDDTTLRVNGEDSGVVVSEKGSFSVKVTLKNSSEEQIFSLSLQDEAGNVSANTKVYITYNTDAEGDEQDEEDNDNEEEKEPLTDIEGHWAEDYIEELYETEVVSGNNGLFRPDDPLNRAEVVKIALLTFELPLVWEEEESIAFTDVKEADWFYNYVTAAASSYKMVKGYNDQSYKPGNNVTRGEALKILFEAAGLHDLETVSPNFSDVDTINDWFAPYSAYAKSTGIVGGYGDGTFRGNQSITRAELCKIAVELMEYLEAN